MIIANAVFTYKSIGLIFLPFLFFSNLYSQQFEGYKKKMIVENQGELILSVDFQKRFNQDTLSLKINGCFIFKGLKMTTNKIVDFTGVSVKISNLRASEKSVTFLNVTKLYKLMIKNGFLHLDLLVNTKIFNFKIDLKKGRFIEISKTIDGGVEICQLNRPYFYD